MRSVRQNRGAKGRGLSSLVSVMVFVTFFALCSVATAPCDAQSGGGGAQDSVDELFVEAAAAFEARRYERALSLLEKIAEINPDPVILFNIARCLEELGRRGDAASIFERALRTGGLSDAQTVEAQRRLESLSATIDQEPRSVGVPLAGPREQPRYMVGLNAGVLFPGLFSELGTASVLGLEASYVLPVDVRTFLRPLAVGAGLSFARPSLEGGSFSEALGEQGQDFTFDLEGRILIVELSASWTFEPLWRSLRLFAQAGPRLYLVETALKATTQGADFGETTQRSARAGAFLAFGGELPLGPVHVFGAVELGGADLDQAITGDISTGAVALRLGARLRF